MPQPPTSPATASIGQVLVTARTVAGSQEALQAMTRAGIDVVVAASLTPADDAWLVERARDVDALVVAMEPVGERLLAQARRLKIIARPGVGCDTVDMGAATRRGVVVTIAAGSNDASVADFSFGLLLEATRGISVAAAGVARGGWERVVGTEAWGKTLAIVGLGRIGQGVARRARGFDMRVLAVTRTTGGSEGEARDRDIARRLDLEIVTLDVALREADFVSLHAPLTPSTRHLIDAAALASMKPGAYLINTARGGLVDEAALADAVRRGHLAGAAVDVLEQQGAGSTSALIGVPGIVVTPHMASFTRESMARVAMSVANAVIARLRGEIPAHVVNPEALAVQRTREA